MPCNSKKAGPDGSPENQLHGAPLRAVEDQRPVEGDVAWHPAGCPEGPRGTGDDELEKGGTRDDDRAVHSVVVQDR
jgi:hypothetical protein